MADKVTDLPGVIKIWVIVIGKLHFLHVWTDLEFDHGSLNPVVVGNIVCRMFLTLLNLITFISLLFHKIIFNYQNDRQLGANHVCVILSRRRDTITSL